MGTAGDPDPLLTETLRRIPFFQDLPADRHECVAILRSGRVCRYRSGEVIQQRGDPPDLLCIVDGAVAVEGTVSPAGPPPGHFGTLDLLLPRQVQGTIRADGPATIFRLPGRCFEPLLASCQHLQRRLLSDFAVHLASRAANEGTQP